ncbi:hypothetical protein GCM10011428_02080 [Streptomyces violaceus]|uniref:hypothetical protein n=1 Tax=Streptomyces violaceus TaxID=1936 RepID=UPI0031E740A1
MCWRTSDWPPNSTAPTPICRRSAHLDHLPPEWWSQRTGTQGAVVRPTADIWAFGVLAHQVLTGGGPTPSRARRPGPLALSAQTYARGTAPLRLDAGLADDMRRLIADCLAPDHTTRLPHTAPGIAARIEDITGGPRRRRRRLVPAVAAGFVVLTRRSGRRGGPARRRRRDAGRRP